MATNRQRWIVGGFLLVVAAALVGSHVAVHRTQFAWRHSCSGRFPETTSVYVYGPAHGTAPRSVEGCSNLEHIDVEGHFDPASRTLALTSSSAGLASFNSTSSTTRFLGEAELPDHSGLAWWARALEVATPFADFPPDGSRTDSNVRPVLRPTATRLPDGRWQATVSLAGIPDLDDAFVTLRVRPRPEA